MEPIRTNQPNHNQAKDHGSNPGGAQATRTADGGKDVDLVGDAKGLADKVASQARDLVGSQIDKQKESSAGELGKVANALRQSSDELSDTMAGPYIEKAAAMLDRVSGSVRNANVRDAIRSTERFARREPLLFLGGAFAVGLLAARFLKSSAPDDGDSDGPLLLEAGPPVPQYGGAQYATRGRQRGRMQQRGSQQGGMQNRGMQQGGMDSGTQQGGMDSSTTQGGVHSSTTQGGAAPGGMYGTTSQGGTSQGGTSQGGQHSRVTQPGGMTGVTPQGGMNQDGQRPPATPASGPGGNRGRDGGY